MSSLGNDNKNGQAYWRSLDEVADTPEFRSFMHREFPSGASELLDGVTGVISFASWELPWRWREWV